MKTATESFQKLETSVVALRPRVARAASSLLAETERALAAFERVRSTKIVIIRHRWYELDKKLLTELAEEADGNARLLVALSALCERALAGFVPLTADVFQLHMDRIYQSFVCSSGCLFFPVCGAGPSLRVWARVWQDSVDATRSTVTGDGTKAFISYSRGLNVIRVIPRVRTAEIAEYVSPDDVALICETEDGVTFSSHREDSGAVVLSYAVNNPSAVKIWLQLRICGVLLLRCGVPVGHFAGRLRKSLIVSPGPKHGIAASTCGQYIVVSYYSEHVLRVYHTDSGIVHGSSNLLFTLGGLGHAPKEFKYPVKMCTTPAGNLLVCEFGNGRVQELSALGVIEPAHVRFFTARGACCVALHADVMAVGTGNATIELMSYLSGEHIRTIGVWGSGPGAIGLQCEGVCFTLDGARLLAAEFSNNRVSLFHVDGRFDKLIGDGIICSGCNDVTVALDGEIIVAEFAQHRLCVFDAEGSTRLRSICALENPAALAQASCLFFVLENNSTRVQVYE